MHAVSPHRAYVRKQLAVLPPNLRDLRLGFSQTVGAPVARDGWIQCENTVAELVGASDALQSLAVRFCPAVLEGRWRDATTALFADMVVVEVTDGRSLDALLSQVGSTGLSCLVQTTEQHLRIQTTLTSAEIEAELGEPLRGFPTAEEIAKALGAHQPTATVLGVRAATQAGCPAFRVQHTPVTAFRLIFVLGERFDFRRQGDVWDGLRRWRRLVDRLAEQLSATIPPWDADPTRTFPLQARDALVACTSGELLTP